MDLVSVNTQIPCMFFFSFFAKPLYTKGGVHVTLRWSRLFNLAVCTWVNVLEGTASWLSTKEKPLFKLYQCSLYPSSIIYTGNSYQSTLPRLVTKAAWKRCWNPVCKVYVCVSSVWLIFVSAMYGLHWLTIQFYFKQQNRTFIFVGLIEAVSQYFLGILSCRLCSHSQLALSAILWVRLWVSDVVNCNVWRDSINVLVSFVFLWQNLVLIDLTFSHWL